MVEITYPLQGIEYFRLTFAERQIYNKLKAQAKALERQRNKAAEKKVIPTQGEVTYPLKDKGEFLKLTPEQKAEYKLLKAAALVKLHEEAVAEALARPKPVPVEQLPLEQRTRIKQRLPAKKRKEIIPILSEMTKATLMESEYWYDAFMCFIQHELECERSVTFPGSGTLIPEARIDRHVRRVVDSSYHYRPKAFTFKFKSMASLKQLLKDRYPLIDKATFDEREKWRNEDLA